MAKKSNKKEEDCGKEPQSTGSVIKDVLESSALSIIRKSANRVISDVQQKIYETEKKVLMSLYIAMVAFVGCVFVLVSFIFLIEQYSELTIGWSALVLGLIILVISLLLLLISKKKTPR